MVERVSIYVGIELFRKQLKTTLSGKIFREDSDIDLINFSWILKIEKNKEISSKIINMWIMIRQGWIDYLDKS